MSEFRAGLHTRVNGVRFPEDVRIVAPQGAGEDDVLFLGCLFESGVETAGVVTFRMCIFQRGLPKKLDVRGTLSDG
jgi:hypothetical protein